MKRGVWAWPRLSVDDDDRGWLFQRYFDGSTNTAVP